MPSHNRASDRSVAPGRTSWAKSTTAERSSEVRVITPSRLHCGLFRFHHESDRQFGGVGMMVDRPGVELRLSRSSQMRIVGPCAQDVGKWALRTMAALGLPAGTACRIEVRTACRRHVGLGLGTQLALGVVSGLTTLFEGRRRTASQLATLAGRGRRSAIGTHGFLHGGFLVEEGKRSNEALGRLVARVSLPRQWRFVLACPEDQVGLSGEAEARVMAQLPHVPDSISRQLRSLAMDQLWPAAEAGGFEAFSEALYAYGILAGNCFSQVQGGPFATPELQALVASIRELGVRGVGQSSWGPTLFAVVRDAHDAQRLVTALGRRHAHRPMRYTIARPSNHGASIRWADHSRSLCSSRQRDD